jgi:chorismate mutase
MEVKSQITTSTFPDIQTWHGTNGLPVKIVGPCSAESLDQVLSTALEISDSFPDAIFRAGIWKPRTRPGKFEGIGASALEWLVEVQQQTKLKVITEVATPAHLEACLKAGIDMVWIGARTTVNPFSVQELAEAFKGVDIPVFVKNPINPDLGLWIGAIERFQNSGITKIAAIHRGFHAFETSPYRNSPRWELVVDLKTNLPGLPVLCDASHISGNPALISSVAQKAMDLDYQGLMIETHINPSVALSDAQQQITPKELVEIINKLICRSSTNPDKIFLNKLLELRSRVDTIDDSIIQALTQRDRLIREIGQFKKSHNVTILQLQRWEEILQRQLNHGKISGLSEAFIKQIYELIHTESIRIQYEELNHL